MVFLTQKEGATTPHEQIIGSGELFTEQICDGLSFDLYKVEPNKPIKVASATNYLLRS